MIRKYLYISTNATQTTHKATKTDGIAETKSRQTRDNKPRGTGSVKEGLQKEKKRKSRSTKRRDLVKKEISNFLDWLDCDRMT